MRSIIVAAALAAALGAHAADKVKIGFVSTLSGPNASIGSDIWRMKKTRSLARRAASRTSFTRPTTSDPFFI